MPSYLVTLPITALVYINVEAEDREEAIAKAIATADNQGVDDPVEINGHEETPNLNDRILKVEVEELPPEGTPDPGEPDPPLYRLADESDDDADTLPELLDSLDFVQPLSDYWKEKLQLLPIGDEINLSSFIRDQTPTSVIRVS